VGLGRFTVPLPAHVYTTTESVSVTLTVAVATLLTGSLACSDIFSLPDSFCVSMFTVLSGLVSLSSKYPAVVSLALTFKSSSVLDGGVGKSIIRWLFTSSYVAHTILLPTASCTCSTKSAGNGVGLLAIKLVTSDSNVAFPLRHATIAAQSMIH
jgi:hypothetical protein